MFELDPYMNSPLKKLFSFGLKIWTKNFLKVSHGFKILRCLSPGAKTNISVSFDRNACQVLKRRNIYKNVAIDYENLCYNVIWISFPGVVFTFIHQCKFETTDLLTIIIVANTTRKRDGPGFFQWKHLKITFVLIEEQSRQVITTVKEILFSC